MIQVSNLVKKYGDHLAVDNLSFEVPDGEIVGFLGPNGAGKSTTMNIITGYLSATSGSVIVNGHDIYEEPEEAKKCIGYLPEQPPVYMDLTVLEYLKFCAELKKVPREDREDEIERVIEATKISDVKSRLIKHLSKGYKQRVGIAQAIMGDPAIIILDEPTVGLDPMQIIEIRDLMKELAKEHTVILSSHILSEISAVCNTVLIINHGQLVVADKAANLSKHLNARSSVYLKVKGSIEAIEEKITPISDDAEFELIDEKDQIITFSVTSPSGEDLREAIFFACAENKLPILEMTTKEMNLEDIFLELTKN